MVCAVTLQHLAIHSRHSLFHHLRPILLCIYHSWINPGFFMSRSLWGLHCCWIVTSLHQWPHRASLQESQPCHKLPSTINSPCLTSGLQIVPCGRLIHIICQVLLPTWCIVLATLDYNFWLLIPRKYFPEYFTPTVMSFY